MSGASSLLPICLVDEDLRRLCALLFFKLHIGALFEAVIRPLQFFLCVSVYALLQILSGVLSQSPYQSPSVSLA